MIPASYFDFRFACVYRFSFPVSRHDTSKGSNADHRVVRRAGLMFGLSLVYSLSPAVALGSELSGVVALTSEYIYRGRAMSDGDPAIQLGLDVETDVGFFAGLWASTIDLRSQVGGTREVEPDLRPGVGRHEDVADLGERGAQRCGREHGDIDGIAARRVVGAARDDERRSSCDGEGAHRSTIVNA